MLVFSVCGVFLHIHWKNVHIHWKNVHIHWKNVHIHWKNVFQCTYSLEKCTYSLEKCSYSLEKCSLEKCSYSLEKCSYSLEKCCIFTGCMLCMCPTIYKNFFQSAEVIKYVRLKFLSFSYHQLLHLTLVLLNPDILCLCKQCRSRSVGF